MLLEDLYWLKLLVLHKLYYSESPYSVQKRAGKKSRYEEDITN
jgi:hypothetical protein